VTERDETREDGMPTPHVAAPGDSAAHADTRAGHADTKEASASQPALFDSPEEADTGYRGPTACAVAGITYRQLDYWARTGLVVPSVRDASGSGTQRLYSFRDIIVLKVVKRLLEAGVSLQNIRVAVEQLRERGTEDLASITLISDGTTVYECRSPEEIIDLLQGGQAVFGIAVAGTLREVQGHLAAFPAEHPEAGQRDAADEAQPGADVEAADGGPADAHVDELASRRRRRSSA
jgi:DNA-binding transcriptional MerR regulator